MTTQNKILLGLGILAFLVGVFFATRFYTNLSVETFTTQLRNNWRAENQAIFDNLATLKAKNGELERQLNTAKGQIKGMRDKKKEEFASIERSGDPDLLANYFDKTIDEYVPEGK